MTDDHANIKDLAGKVAVLAGAGGPGMGRATARALSAAGAHVAILDINADAAAATADVIRSAGGSASSHVLDLTDASAVEGCFNDIFAAHKRFDILFNNTGVAPPAGLKLTEFAPEMWDRFIDLNLKSAFLGMRYAIPLMVQAGQGGAIVNNASSSGLRANVSGAPYGVAKAGVIHLTKVAALEYGPVGIRVNAVAPYSISRRDALRPEGDDWMRPAPDAADNPVWQNAQLPMMRSGKGFEVAAAVKFLVSDQASWITGAVIPVDGGSTAGYFGRVR